MPVKRTFTTRFECVRSTHAVSPSTMWVTRPVQIEHLVVTPGIRHEPLRASAAAGSSANAHSASSSRRRIEAVNTLPPRSMRLTVRVAVGEAVERDAAEALQPDDVAGVVEDPLGLAPVLDEARVAARTALDLEGHHLARGERGVGAEHVLVRRVLEPVAVEVDAALPDVAQR